MKKLYMVMLVITILILSLSAVTVYADEIAAEQFNADLISDGKLIPTTTNMPSAVKTANVEKSLYDVILTGLENLEEMIDISAFNLSLESDTDSAYLHETYNAVVNQNPNLFYIYIKYQLWHNTNNGRILYIEPTYMENVAHHKEIFERRVAEILSRVIRPGMSDEAKTMVLHDYLVRHAEYNYGTQTMEDHTAYGVIVNELGVCQSYALAYNYLLSMVGVETKFCASEYKYDSAGNIIGGMNHGWSVVKLNGKWYHVDVTWDDPKYSTEEANSKGYVIHDYYLYSDATFKASKGHKDWVVDVTCTDKRYETGMPYQNNEEMHVPIQGTTGMSGFFPMYQFKYNENNGFFYSQAEPAKYNIYFKTKFDGSSFEFITAEEYDAAVMPPDGLYAYRAIDTTEHTMTYSDVNTLTHSYVAFENTTDMQKTGEMIIALYNDNNALVSCKIQNITIPAKQVYGVKFTPIDKNNATKGKVFMWDSLKLTEVTINTVEF